MKSAVPATIVCVAFFAVLGLAGAVEQGAPLARMLWAVPCLAAGAYGVLVCRG